MNISIITYFILLFWNRFELDLVEEFARSTTTSVEIWSCVFMRYSIDEDTKMNHKGYLDIKEQRRNDKVWTSSLFINMG